jgi:hypothetical protein
MSTRQVGNGYTIQFDHKIYQIARPDIRAGLRGAPVRIEVRLDGSLAMRFRSHYYLALTRHHFNVALKAAEASRSVIRT